MTKEQKQKIEKEFAYLIEQYYLATENDDKENAEFYIEKIAYFRMAWNLLFGEYAIESIYTDVCNQTARMMYSK